MSDTKDHDIRRQEVRRMCSVSGEYFEASKVLSEIHEETGLSSQILRCLAFEVALKGLLRLLGITRGFGHDYWKAWCELPEQLRGFLLHDAMTRGSGHVDFSNTQALFKDWQRSFEKARYLYESDFGKSDDQLREISQIWLLSGGKNEDADFRFYGFELTVLVESLHGELDRRVTP
jgi:hypothetical protein